ncbi:hypothetical protein C1J03_09640 [Sulfitobacter sp. SK012]|nr:hypothetical protein C1J03_09640 [Sulfitobacter sp. SK012]
MFQRAANDRFETRLQDCESYIDDRKELDTKARLRLAFSIRSVFALLLKLATTTLENTARVEAQSELQTKSSQKHQIR